MAYDKKIIKEEISKMIKNEGIFDAPAAVLGGIKGAGQNLVGNFRTNAVKSRMDRVAGRIEKDFSKNAQPALKTADKMASSSNQSVKATGQNIQQQINAADGNIKQAVDHIRQAFPSSVGQVIQPGTQQNPQPQINLVQPQQNQSQQSPQGSGLVNKAMQGVANATAGTAQRIAGSRQPKAPGGMPTKGKRKVQQSVTGQANIANAQPPQPQKQQIQQPPVQKQQPQGTIDKFLADSGLEQDKQQLVKKYLSSVDPQKLSMLKGMNPETAKIAARNILDKVTKKQQPTESKKFKLAKWLF